MHSYFYFQDNNLSKSQWIFIKFDMYTDNVQICFGIAHGHGQFLTELSACDMIMAGYYHFTFIIDGKVVILILFLHKKCCDYSLEGSQ